MVKKKNPVKYIVVILCVLALAGIVLFTFGKSFAFFNYQKNGETLNVVTFTGITVNINNSSDEALNLNNAYPMYDMDGMNQDSLDLTLTNTSRKTLSFNLKVENDQDKLNECIANNGTCPSLSTNYIKYSYKIDNGEWSDPANLGANNNIALSESVSGNSSVDVSIKIWIDSTSPNEIQGTYFFGKLIIQATRN